MSLFQDFDASGLYGMTRQAPASASVDTTPGLAIAQGMRGDRSVSLLSPDHPLFWFAGLLAVTVGVIGFASSGHVGPVRAAVHVGK